MQARRRRFAERRKAAGFTQESLAEVVGVDRSTVVRWERGATDPQPWHRPRLAAALALSVDGLAELLGCAQEPEVRPGDGVVEVIGRFRRMDREFGGARLHDAVTTYLQQTVAPRVFGTHRDQEASPTFAAAATLVEMAGWMTHDLGQDAQARRHFQMACGLAGAAGDRELVAHVLGSLGYLAVRNGEPKRAVLHAERGQESLPEPERAAAVSARLYAVRARAFAQAGDAERCLAMIRAAEKVLARKIGPPISPWTNDFDEASLAVDAARCLCRLGRAGAARSWAERVLALRAPQRVRSRAYALAMRSSALLEEGREPEARQARDELVETTRTLGSAPILAEIRALERRFARRR